MHLRFASTGQVPRMHLMAWKAKTHSVNDAALLLFFWVVSLWNGQAWIWSSSGEPELEEFFLRKPFKTHNTASEKSGVGQQSIRSCNKWLRGHSVSNFESLTVWPQCICSFWSLIHLWKFTFGNARDTSFYSRHRRAWDRGEAIPILLLSTCTTVFSKRGLRELLSFSIVSIIFRLNWTHNCSPWIIRRRVI